MFYVDMVGDRHFLGSFRQHGCFSFMHLLCMRRGAVVYGSGMFARSLRFGLSPPTGYPLQRCNALFSSFCWKVLAAVRSGLLASASSPEQAAGGGDSAASDTVEDVPTMTVGAAGHADILREASHYLSAIKVCTAAVCLV